MVGGTDWGRDQAKNGGWHRMVSTEWTFSERWVAPNGLFPGGTSGKGGWHRLGEGPGTERWVAPIGLLLGVPSHNGGWHRLGEGGTRHRTVGGTEWLLLLCLRASLATSVEPTRERIG